MLERLQQVRVERNRAAVGLGGGQLDERADDVRIPVDLELEARLAVALDQRQRRRRGHEADLQPARAAQRARVQPRARQVQQRVGDLLGERQPAPVPTLLGDGEQLLRQVTGDAVEHEPAGARAPRGGHAADPALDRACEPFRHVGRDLELREALDHALDVGGGGVSARRPPLLGLPVEAAPGDRAHGVDDVRAVREGEDHGLVPVGVAPELDVRDRIGGAHPPTVASDSVVRARGARSSPQCAGAGRGRRGAGRRACAR